MLSVGLTDGDTVGVDEGLPELVGCALGFRLEAGDGDIAIGFEELVGCALGSRLEVGEGIETDSPVGSGVADEVNSCGSSFFVPACFTLNSGGVDSDSLMKPRTIPTKLPRLTLTASTRLRNAGLNRIFITKSPSEAKRSAVLPFCIVSCVLFCDQLKQ